MLLLFTAGYSGADGANVRRYSRFSFARLPIHLAASYHDLSRSSIQVDSCIGNITGVPKFRFEIFFVTSVKNMMSIKIFL